MCLLLKSFLSHKSTNMYTGFLLNVKREVATFDLRDNADATRNRFISNASCITVIWTNKCLYRSID